MTTPPVWRDLGPDHRLTGFRCSGCGAVSYPKRRRICPYCRKTPASFQEVPLSLRGTLVSYVVQHYLPSRFEAPLPMGVVDLEGGGRIYGMMTDCKPEELRVGMAVEAVWRRVVEDDGEDLYGFKFRPAVAGGKGTAPPGGSLVVTPRPQALSARDARVPIRNGVASRASPPPPEEAKR